MVYLINNKLWSAKRHLDKDKEGSNLEKGSKLQHTHEINVLIMVA